MPIEPNDQHEARSANKLHALVLSLEWMCNFIAHDSEIASAARRNGFAEHLIEIKGALMRRNVSDSELALERAVERFAFVQSVAFVNRRACAVGINQRV
jgi:hypothetical protein